MTTSGSKAEYLRILTERGFIHQCTDLERLDAAFGAGPVTAYVGYDCTAPSLHAGSLVSIMMLHWLQQTGGRPIVLMGGGTSRIGDPSGKDAARQLMTNETISNNMNGIKRVFSRFIDFGESKAVMVNNADWLDKLNYIEFLRDFGRHFSVNRMLTFDSVKTRLSREEPLSFLEFNYMVLQAYDFVELARRHGCGLQMGGSDQWGNIVNGVDLARRVDEKELFGLTCPLLTTASGAKMGKTADGAVWLNAEQRSPYEYWQYFRNTEDADVGKFLKLFTTLPMAEIAKLEALQGREINDAKVVLATEGTALCPGREEAEQAKAAATAMFTGNTEASGAPSVDVPRARFEAGISLIELLRLASLVESNTEARTMIKQGGARLNDEAIKDEKFQVTTAQLKGDSLKLSAGKKRHAVIRAT